MEIKSKMFVNSDDMPPQVVIVWDLIKVCEIVLIDSVSETTQEIRRRRNGPSYWKGSYR